MKSFFKDEKIELFNADCTQKSNFDTEFFDLGITSPPYNVGIEYGDGWRGDHEIIVVICFQIPIFALATTVVLFIYHLFYRL